jgi:hypothetical protein
MLRRKFLQRSSALGIAFFTGLSFSCAQKNYRVRFTCQALAPPANLRLHITELPGQSFSGFYIDGIWEFRVPYDNKIAVHSLRFTLDGNYIQKNKALTYRPVPDSIFHIPRAELVFTYLDEIQSNTRSQVLLAKAEPRREKYDIVVIGAGMGGGILASELAIWGYNVAIIEAGALLFPTHVGNLPRRHLPGQFDKNIWSLWHHFRAINYRSGQPSAYVGSQTFNLGGRSLFWAPWPRDSQPWIGKPGHPNCAMIASLPRGIPERKGFSE